MADSIAEKAEEPLTIGQRIFACAFGLVAMVAFPLGVWAWFSNNFLPFLPGSSEVSAQVEQKYTTMRPGQTKKNRNAYHVSYKYEVEGQPLDGMAVVPKEFYEKIAEGQNIQVRFTTYQPKRSFPAECPPSVGDMIFFGISILIVIIGSIVGFFAIYYGIRSK